jgi:hypothetical protein
MVARVLALVLLPALAYRIEDPNNGPPNTTATFRPYDRGFVGRVANPQSARPWRVNPGNPWSHAKPNVFRGVLPRQNCSGMVGPIGGIYFCTSLEAGYCDRRSGACFCSAGYAGADCSLCRPTHAREPANGTCVPRLPCPNGCSGAGACDPATGACACEPGRKGVDCSLQACRLLHRWCAACNATDCLSCEAGYFWSSGGAAVAGGGPPGCEPCTRFDPRCAECSAAEGCTACADPLLRGARRSGRRRVDPPLPWDEDARQLAGGRAEGEAFFGTQAGAAHAGVEAFLLATPRGAIDAVAAGIVRGAWSPAYSCASALRVNASVGRVRVAVAALGAGFGGLGSGTLGGGLPAVYDLACGRPAAQRTDAFYGYGPDGAGAEGPVRGAAYGSSGSPVVYPPGIAAADGGSSLVDVQGEIPVDTRVVDMTVDLLRDAVALAAAMAPVNATPRNGTAYPWMFGGVWPLIEPTGRGGYDPRRYPDYDGYAVDSVRGWLNSNETVVPFSPGNFGRADTPEGAPNQANWWSNATSTAPALICVAGDVASLGRGAAPVCYLDTSWAPNAQRTASRPNTPWRYTLPPYYATRLRALAGVGAAGAHAARAAARRLSTGNVATGAPSFPPKASAPAAAPDFFPSYPAPNGTTVTARALFTPSAGASGVAGPLTDTAFACEESPADGVWDCAPTPQSHAACGHAGVYAFSAPFYVAVEGWGDAGGIGVTVRRSGGGMGRGEVTVSLRHGTTDDSDVRLGGGGAGTHGGGGGARRLVFEEGVVALTFWVTVLDDSLVEPFGTVGRLPAAAWDKPSATLPPALAALLDPTSAAFPAAAAAAGGLRVAPNSLAAGIAAAGTAVAPGGAEGAGWARPPGAPRNASAALSGWAPADLAAAALAGGGVGAAGALYPPTPGDLSAALLALGALAARAGGAEFFDATSRWRAALAGATGGLGARVLNSSAGGGLGFEGARGGVEAYPGAGTAGGRSGGGGSDGVWASRLSPHEWFTLALSAPCCGGALSPTAAEATVAVVDDDAFKVDARVSGVAGWSSGGGVPWAPGQTAPGARAAAAPRGPAYAVPPPGTRPGALHNGSYGDATAPPPAATLLRALLLGDGGVGAAAGSPSASAALLAPPLPAALAAFPLVGTPTEVRVTARDPSGRPIAASAVTFARLHLDTVHGPDVVPAVVPGEELWAVALAPVGGVGGLLTGSRGGEELSARVRSAAAGVLRGYAAGAAAGGGAACAARFAVGGGASGRGFDGGPPPTPVRAPGSGLASPLQPLIGEAGAAPADAGTGTHPSAYAAPDFPRLLAAAEDAFSCAGVPPPTPEVLLADVEAALAVAFGRDARADARWAPGGVSARLRSLLAQALGGVGGVGGVSLATSLFSPLPSSAAAGAPASPSYAALLLPREAGLHVLSAFHAARGGLRGEYFGNAALAGEPLLTRVDPGVAFVWAGAPVFEVTVCVPPCGGRGGFGAPGGCGVPGSSASDFSANASDGWDAAPFASAGGGRGGGGGCAPGSWGEGASVRWSGALRVPSVGAGVGQLAVLADDGARLWFDGALVIDAWGEAPPYETMAREGGGVSPGGGRAAPYPSALSVDPAAAAPAAPRRLLPSQLVFPGVNPPLAGTRLGATPVTPLFPLNGSASYAGDAPPPVQCAFFSALGAPLAAGASPAAAFAAAASPPPSASAHSLLCLAASAPGALPAPSADSPWTWCSVEGGGSPACGASTKPWCAPADSPECVAAAAAAAVADAEKYYAPAPRPQPQGTAAAAAAEEAFSSLEATLRGARAVGALAPADAADAALRSAPILFRPGVLHSIVLEYRNARGFGAATLAWVPPAAAPAAAAAVAAGNASLAAALLRAVAPVPVPPHALYALRPVGGTPLLTYVRPGAAAPPARPPASPALAAAFALGGLPRVPLSNATVWADGGLAPDAAGISFLPRDAPGGGAGGGVFPPPRAGVAAVAALLAASAARPPPPAAVGAAGDTGSGGRAVAALPTAWGAGLTGPLAAGAPAPVHVLPRDALGNPRGGEAGGDAPWLQAQLLSADPVFRYEPRAGGGGAAVLGARRGGGVRGGPLAGGAADAPPCPPSPNRTFCVGGGWSAARDGGGVLSGAWAPQVAGLWGVGVLLPTGGAAARALAHVRESPAVVSVGAGAFSGAATSVWGAGVHPTLGWPGGRGPPAVAAAGGDGGKDGLGADPGVSPGAVAGAPALVLVAPRDGAGNALLLRSGRDGGGDGGAQLRILPDAHALLPAAFPRVTVTAAHAELPGVYAEVGRCSAVLVPLAGAAGSGGAVPAPWSGTAVTLPGAGGVGAVAITVSADGDAVPDVSASALLAAAGVAGGEGVPGRNASAAAAAAGAALSALRDGLRAPLLACTYTPRVAGRYTVSVLASVGAAPPTHLGFSPYTVVVPPGPTVASACTLDNATYAAALPPSLGAAVASPEAMAGSAVLSAPNRSGVPPASTWATTPLPNLPPLFLPVDASAPPVPLLWAPAARETQPTFFTLTLRDGQGNARVARNVNWTVSAVAASPADAGAATWPSSSAPGGVPPYGGRKLYAVAAAPPPEMVAPVVFSPGPYSGAVLSASDFVVGANMVSVALAADGRVALAGAYGGPAYVSTNGGVSWAPTGGGWTAFWGALAVSGDGSRLLLCEFRDVFCRVSGDGGATWAPSAGHGFRPSAAAVTSDGGTVVLNSHVSPGLYKSTNGGATFAPLPAPATLYALALSADGATLIGATTIWKENGVTCSSCGEVYVSRNGGGAWGGAVAHGTLGQVTAVAASASGTTLAAAVSQQGALLSRDSGATWALRSPVVTPPTPPSVVWAFVHLSGDGHSVVLTPASSAGPVFSVDAGATWAALDSSPASYADAAFARDAGVWLAAGANQNWLRRIALAQSPPVPSGGPGVTAWVEWPPTPLARGAANSSAHPALAVANATVTYLNASRVAIAAPCGGLLCALHVRVLGAPVAGSPFAFARPPLPAPGAAGVWAPPFAAGVSSTGLITLADGGGAVVAGEPDAAVVKPYAVPPRNATAPPFSVEAQRGGAAWPEGAAGAAATAAAAAAAGGLSVSLEWVGGVRSWDAVELALSTGGVPASPPPFTNATPRAPWAATSLAAAAGGGGAPPLPRLAQALAPPALLGATLATPYYAHALGLRAGPLRSAPGLCGVPTSLTLPTAWLYGGNSSTASLSSVLADAAAAAPGALLAALAPPLAATLSAREVAGPSVKDAAAAAAGLAAASPDALRGFLAAAAAALAAGGADGAAEGSGDAGDRWLGPPSVAALPEGGWGGGGDGGAARSAALAAPGGAPFSPPPPALAFTSATGGVTLTPLPGGFVAFSALLPRAGLYRLRAWLGGERALSVGAGGGPEASDFFVAAAPGGAAPGPSGPEGTGGALSGGARAGVPAAVALVARDSWGNRAGRHGVEVGLWRAEYEEAGGGPRVPLRPLPVPGVPGTYALFFTPTASGVGSLRLSAVMPGEGLAGLLWAATQSSAPRPPPQLPRAAAGGGAPLLSVPPRGFAGGAGSGADGELRAVVGAAPAGSLRGRWFGFFRPALRAPPAGADGSAPAVPFGGAAAGEDLEGGGVTEAVAFSLCVAGGRGRLLISAAPVSEAYWVAPSAAAAARLLSFAATGGDLSSEAPLSEGWTVVVDTATSPPAAPPFNASASPVCAHGRGGAAFNSPAPTLLRSHAFYALYVDFEEREEEGGGATPCEGARGCFLGAGFGAGSLATLVGGAAGAGGAGGPSLAALAASTPLPTSFLFPPAALPLGTAPYAVPVAPNACVPNASTVASWAQAGVDAGALPPPPPPPATGLAARAPTTLRVTLRDAFGNPTGGARLSGDSVSAWAVLDTAPAPPPPAAVALRPGDFSYNYEGSGVWRLNFTLPAPGAYLLRVAVNAPAEVGAHTLPPAAWAAHAEAAGALLGGEPINLVASAAPAAGGETAPVVNLRWAVAPAAARSACGAVSNVSGATGGVSCPSPGDPFDLTLALFAAAGRGWSQLRDADALRELCHPAWVPPGGGCELRVGFEPLAGGVPGAFAGAGGERAAPPRAGPPAPPAASLATAPDGASFTVSVAPSEPGAYRLVVRLGGRGPPLAGGVGAAPPALSDGLTLTVGAGAPTGGKSALFLPAALLPLAPGDAVVPLTAPRAAYGAAAGAPPYLLPAGPAPNWVPTTGSEAVRVVFNLAVARAAAGATAVPPAAVAISEPAGAPVVPPAYWPTTRVPGTGSVVAVPVLPPPLPAAVRALLVHPRTPILLLPLLNVSALLAAAAAALNGTTLAAAAPWAPRGAPPAPLSETLFAALAAALMADAGGVPVGTPAPNGSAPLIVGVRLGGAFLGAPLAHEELLAAQRPWLTLAPAAAAGAGAGTRLWAAPLAAGGAAPLALSTAAPLRAPLLLPPQLSVGASPGGALLRALAAPSNASGAPLFSTPPRAWVAAENGSLSAAATATRAAVVGAHWLHGVLPFPAAFAGAAAGGTRCRGAQPGNGLSLSLWSTQAAWEAAEAAAAARVAGAAGTLSPFAAAPRSPWNALEVAPGGCPPAGGGGASAAPRCVEVGPGGPLLRSRGAWAAGGAPASAAVAQWSGALTAPPASPAGSAHTLTLTVICGGPCAVEIDGRVVVEWREEAAAGAPLPAPASGAPTLAVRGAAQGAGMAAASGALLPPGGDDAAAALACAGVDPALRQGAAVLRAPPLVVGAGNPVALRVLLRARGGGAPRGEGVVALLWAVGAAAGEAPPVGAPGCAEGMAPVPVEAFSWDAVPMQGSPVPVWME